MDELASLLDRVWCNVDEPFRPVEITRTTTPPPSPAPSFGVAVVAIKEGRFLVSQRLAGCKSAVGLWSLPGGKIEFGESIRKAAVRELLEETGLIGVPVGDVGGVGPVFHVAERIADGEHHVSLYVASHVVGGELGNPEPAKHSEWSWVGIHECLALSPTMIAASAIAWRRNSLGL